MNIILASASPRRRELLGLITPQFAVETSDVDESALHADAPAKLVQLLAQAKCAAVAAVHPDDVVLGCDTVVDVDGKVLGKPSDREDARRMMQLLQGRAHLVHTGVCLRLGAREQLFCVTTQVTFLPLSAQEIEAYIATDEPYDKAGGYAIQGGAAKFVRGIFGCYFNVMGLPVSRVYGALREFEAL